MTLRRLSFLLVLPGCAGAPTGDDSKTQDSLHDADSADSADTGEAPVAGLVPAAVMTGTYTFHLALSEVGGVDCDTTRAFTGVDMGETTPFSCPSCSAEFMGSGTITDDTIDCFDAAFVDYPDGWSTPVYSYPVRTEYWGWGKKAFYRSTMPAADASGKVDDGSFRAPDEGVEETFTAVGTSNTTAGSASYTVDGTVIWVTDPAVLVPDPTYLPTEPYTCGWPQNDPGTLVDPAAVAVGAVAPAASFVDQCGEPVRLRDFAGSWLIGLRTTADCDACLENASLASAYATRAAADGEDVRVVTFFAGTDDEYAAAVELYGAAGPVFRDRGYGSMIAYVGGFNPAWSTSFVVDPDQRLASVTLGGPDYSVLPGAL